MVIGEAATRSNKTIVASFVGGVSVGEARITLHNMGVPMYTFPEQAGFVLGAMHRYGQWCRKQKGNDYPELDRIDREAAQRALLAVNGGKTLGEAQTRPLLAAYGLPLIPGKVVSCSADAVQAAQQLGYPVVLKIVSSDLLHKSEAGGIRLNLGDDQAVQIAYEEMLDSIRKSHPEARLEGILVEKMAPRGYELIVGMRRDPAFGPLVMFGLGGIYVELFGDVAFRVAPMTRQDAVEMIHQTKAGKLLSGLRGQPPADIDAVVDCILRLGQLALDFPQIEEIEMNPLLLVERA